MPLNLLINKAKVSELLQVAIGVPDADFEKYIEEAQKFDLKPLVCEEFYFDLLKNKDDENFEVLIDGGEYVFEGKDYAHDGLKGVLAYFAYARFQLESQTLSTSHGMVQKTNPYSTPVSLEDRRSTYYKKREEANSIMQDVVRFIERNIPDYPTWECSSNCGSKKTASFSTRVIQ
jgi:hypothetical protein